MPSPPGNVGSQQTTAPPSTPAISSPHLNPSLSPSLNNRTYLNQRLQKYRLTTYYDLKHDGPQHAQRWRCFCYIGKIFVGCSNWCSNKDTAKEEAAGHALEWLDKYGYP
ncbi:hypothetical protein CPB86DRAFT_214548 [Serendipita vermifera]|nr:hypothetical protein CPB86DRAFT_214548 [Serendipita vermifera]